MDMVTESKTSFPWDAVFKLNVYKNRLANRDENSTDHDFPYKYMQ